MSPAFTRRTICGTLLASPLIARSGLADELPTLRITVLKFGTVNWELDTIKSHNLDRRHGFSLDIHGVASGSAAKIAFEGGGTDIIVSDWIWVARQRAERRDFVFSPYARSVGGVIVPASSDAQTLPDLKGAKIGIAGGPLDKSWLILQAYAASLNFDLKNETEQVFGAPPLLSHQLRRGGLDALATYWHFEARLRAKGFRRLVSVQDAAAALGLPTEIPLLGYVFRNSFFERTPSLIDGFLAASRDAKALLREDDSIWEGLRASMKPKSDAEFVALRDGFRDGIPDGAVSNTAGAEKLFDVMAALGGEKLVGRAATLPDGVFHSGS